VPYLLAIVPALLALAGLVTMIEMGYHLSLAYDPSRPIELFGIEITATSVAAWVVAVALFAAGLVALRWVAGRIRQRWGEVNQAMDAQRAKQ